MESPRSPEGEQRRSPEGEQRGAPSLVPELPANMIGRPVPEIGLPSSEGGIFRLRQRVGCGPLVLFTDGVSEAESAGGDQFGNRRIEQVVRRLSDRPAQEIVTGLVNEVLEWTGERGQNDDLTLMVVKALPEGEVAAGT